MQTQTADTIKTTATITMLTSKKTGKSTFTVAVRGYQPAAASNPLAAVRAFIRSNRLAPSELD